MPNDYLVGNAPAGAAYAAPLVGLRLGQALARLPQDYADGATRARMAAMQSAFPQGVPRKPDGSPDLDRMADTAMQIGGLDYARPLLNFLVRSPSADSPPPKIPASTAPTGGQSQGPSARPSSDQPANSPSIMQRNTSASVLPSADGGDATIANRYKLAAQHLRERAASYAALKQDELARTFAQQADAYDARAKQFLGPTLQQGAAEPATSEPDNTAR